MRRFVADVDYAGGYTLSPDGQWLIYSSVIEGYAKLLRLDVNDPSRRFQITTGESNDIDAWFSPDGKRLAFTALDKLWMMDLPRGTPRRVTNVEGATGEHSPVWSPDGRYVAFNSAADNLSTEDDDAVQDRALEVATAAEHGDELGKLRGGVAVQGGRIDLSQVPSTKPAFTSIHVDDRGYLWIRPALPADAAGSAFDVLDPGGKYLGRVELPVKVDERMPVVVRGDRLYTVVLSEDDVPQLVRFRVEGRASAETRVAGR